MKKVNPPANIIRCFTGGKTAKEVHQPPRGENPKLAEARTMPVEKKKKLAS